MVWCEWQKMGKEGDSIMGAVKAMAMDMEDEFIDACASLVEVSESFFDYKYAAIINVDMVPHLSDNDVSNIITEVWNEYWSNYS